MDNSVNAFIVGQYSQDRIAAATSRRRAREAEGERERMLRHARQWLTRRAPAVPATPETSRTITALPPF
jgi:hypothetical protein